MLALGQGIAKKARVTGEGSAPGDMALITLAFLLALGMKAHVLQLAVDLLATIPLLVRRGDGAGAVRSWAAARSDGWRLNAGSLRTRLLRNCRTVSRIHPDGGQRCPL